MRQALAARPFLGTLALTFLAIAALFLTDTFLAKMDRNESRVEASRLFEQGRVLMGWGENAEAIKRVKDALSIDRGNRDYLRTLAEAQLAAGDTKGAEATLGDLLESEPTDGLASLLMGRVLAKEGRFAEAISYFHRAIYGRWSKDAEENRRRARFELIDLLAKQNFKEELLAELLPVQEHAPQDIKTRTHIGELFLMAGSPTRAVEVFRGILHDAPENAEGHKGMGEAEFARGNYRASQRDFQAALRLAPDDQGVLRQLDRCDEVLQLDPTLRGLGSEERFRRSLKLVELTLNEVSQCAKLNPPAELRELLAKATRALKTHGTAGQQIERSEANLDLAEQLWQLRKRECSSGAMDTPLALVMARLAQ